MDTFITDVLNTVDQVIGNFVQTSYQGLIQGNATVITLLFTFYIIVLGYRFVTHDLSSDLNTITRHLVSLLIVYGLIMSWDLYNVFVYNIFTNEPGILAQTLVDATGSFKGGESTADALNKIYASGMDYAAQLFGKIPVINLQYLFYGISVWLVTMILSMYAMLLFIYAKMAMAIALAIGPIFLPMMLWESTRGLFAAWLRKLTNFALIPIITCSILSLMLTVMQVTIPIDTPIEKDEFHGILPYIALSLATVMLLLQVFPICSALSGGITLASLSKGVGAVKGAIGNGMKMAGLAAKATGLTAAGQAINNAAKDKIKNSIAARRSASKKSAGEGADKK